ncbi:MAG: hypothetical protein KatS3mg060_2278 [Dehalococcoidia bacterium]|nr:MAG: hypothetical protein KatS3mg060_2278 [Dehalococcoidia bacterium]
MVIGEVKEGQARLNPALRRADTAAFALRRVACCPDDQVEEEARAVVGAGQREFTMPGGDALSRPAGGVRRTRGCCRARGPHRHVAPVC